MRAMVFSEYGPPELLRLEEVPIPTPGEGEVLVRVHAASINDWDWGLVRGVPFVNRLLFGWRRPRIGILGLDVAGRIEAVGAGVSRFRIGDDVHGDLSDGGWGAFAEFVAARERDLEPMPAGMAFDEAAAVPHAACLALQGLEGRRPLAPGQRVLINGAGGGVGTLAIQLVKAFGAEVTAIDSAGKLDAMRSLGADRVVDYAAEDVTRDGERYHLILDLGGFRPIAAYRHSLTHDGICLFVGGTMPRIAQAALLGPLLSIGRERTMGVLALKANRGLARFRELYEAGVVAPVIARRYPLEEVPEALRAFSRAEHVGKLIITM